ncbi:ATP-binding protein [Rhodococcus marinonascens]|uniref:ATP-binding protein n=1 Tax=Rhodococcus marinonascens TaxID=38311 RepID=UPI000934828B|nr:ATP-binding protein [Rhodococcus marinonascens]
MAKNKTKSAPPAAKIRVLSDVDLALLEAREAAATGQIRKAWLSSLVKRQYARRATIAANERARSDRSDRTVHDLDERGFTGPGGGRMGTVMPPAEYRGTTVQVAGLYPWSVGAHAPLLGTPLGLHLATGAPVCFDPLSAKEAKAITAPACFIIALNGFGKSTLLRRIALGDIAAGVRVLWPGDVKPDGRKLTEAVGGQVNEVGYGGIGRLNPLDPGPIGAAIEQLTDPLMRQQTSYALHARQVNIVAALCEIVRRGELLDFEQTLLASAIRLLYTPVADGGAGFGLDQPAILDDLIELLTSSNPELLEDAVAENAAEYFAAIKGLRRTLRALVKGRFGEVFNGASTVRIDVNAPSMCLDMSSVPQDDAMMRSAVLLTGWNEAFAAIEAAHVLADAGLGPNLAFHVLMDELWQVLQSGQMMVGRIDALVRLQRALGVGITFVTHSIAELDKAGALGLLERSRARIVGPVPEAELVRLEKVIQFSQTEKTMLTNWSNDADLNSPIDQKTARRRKAAEKAGVGPGSKQQTIADPVAAGTGQFLLKLGEGNRPGTPFKVWVPPVERESGIHNTDERLDAATKDRENAGVAA